MKGRGELSIGLPIVGLIVAVIGLVLGRKSKWGRFPIYIVPLLNLTAIWLTVNRRIPDYFFLSLSMAALTGVVWAFFMVSRDDDLLFKSFGRQYGFVLAVYSTVWWVGALLLTA